MLMGQIKSNVYESLFIFNQIFSKSVMKLGIGWKLNCLKGHSYENVCEIIALNDRLDPN
jgi:hypothetical protein